MSLDIIRYGEVQELSIVKETEKRLTIEGDCWTTLNKSDLETYLNSRACVYSYSEARAKKVYIEALNDQISLAKERLDKLQGFVDKLK